MKKSLLFSLLCTALCVLAGRSVQAQITAVYIDTTTSLTDALDRSCAPASKKVSFNGIVTGTYTASDSLTVIINFGDGSSESMNVGIAAPAKTFSGTSKTHTYLSPGSYRTSIIVRASFAVADTMRSFIIDNVLAPCVGSFSVTGYAKDSIPVCGTLPHPYILYGNSFGYGTALPSDSAKVHIDFGDGHDSTFTLNLVIGSGTYGFNYEVTHMYTSVGYFTPVVRVITTTGASDTAAISGFTITDKCAIVKGKLYFDDNNNCIPEAGERGIKWISVAAVNTATFDTTWTAGWTDSLGLYSINLSPGSYTIVPMVNYFASYYSGTWGFGGDVINPTCPASGTATVTVTTGTYTRDFAYECSPVDSFDASVLVSAKCYVPGDTTLISVWGGSWSRLHPYKCLDIPGTLTLTLDPKLHYAGHLDGKVPSSISGSIITWNLSSGTSVADFISRIKVAVVTTAVMGDSVRCVANVTLTGSIYDPVLYNNTYTHSRAVTSSYDPNVKEAAPGGRGAQGYIPTNTPMSYTIHFQNTGTAAARNIVITDKLDSKLDAASFHMLSSTHGVIVYREGKNVKFQFNNINLPDSGSNYYGSMGSVTYAILPLRDLAPGTEIRNTAAIYFDYNDPVITNTTLNTIETTTNIQNVTNGNLNASIFPNPANNQLMVKLDNNTAFTVTVTDMLGRVAAMEHSTGNVLIHTAQIPAGMYLIQIADKAGNTLNAKVMVQH